MVQNNWTKLSIDELKQKEKVLKIVLSMFVGVLTVLIGVLVFTIIYKGMTPLLAVPFALLPLLLFSLKSLKDIRAEIQARQ
jgi:hypothetical protein